MKSKLRACEQKLSELERVRSSIQEVRSENTQLFEAKAILQVS